MVRRLRTVISYTKIQYKLLIRKFLSESLSVLQQELSAISRERRELELLLAGSSFSASHRLLHRITESEGVLRTIVQYLQCSSTMIDDLEETEEKWVEED